MTGVQNIEVAQGDDGTRLDHWFKRHFPDLGLGRLQKLLRTGQIRVNGGRVKANHRVETGQVVRVPPLQNKPRRVSEKRASISEEDRHQLQEMLLHQDDRLLVINKPPGLAVQGGSGTKRHLDGMLEGLKLDKAEKPRLVHRLDKDTSGVLVLARDAAAARSLGKAFQSKAVRKLYWALVVGQPAIPAGLINMALLKDGGKGQEKVRPSESLGQSAKSIYQMIEHAGKRTSWLAMEPLTGRTHQLRVHAAEALSCPILGDGKYGGAEAFIDGGGLSRKLHLHARAVSVPHPDGGAVVVQADLPDHMTRAWDFFGFDVGDAEANNFLDPDT